jgi:hypothetical protein
MNKDSEKYIKLLEDQNETLQKTINDYVEKYEKHCTVSCSHLYGYSDKDYIMLHVCFELLVCYVKDELNGKIEIRDEDEMVKQMKESNYHQDAIDLELKMLRENNAKMIEMKEVYDWWVNEYITGVHEQKISYPKQYEIEQAYLLKLINMRQYLWT